MPKIDLSGRHYMTWGLKDCGKSYFNNYIMQNFQGNFAVFDTMREHNDYGQDNLRFCPSESRGDELMEQFEVFLQYVIDNRDRYDLVVVDEINRLHKKGGQLHGPLADLVDFNAHYGLGIGMIARRPTQVHTDVSEMADYHFFFRLQGKNDIDRLNHMKNGLGDSVKNLRKREYIILFPDYSFEKRAPISANVQHSKGF